MLFEWEGFVVVCCWCVTLVSLNNVTFPGEISLVEFSGPSFPPIVFRLAEPGLLMRNQNYFLLCLKLRYHYNYISSLSALNDYHPFKIFQNILFYVYFVHRYFRSIFFFLFFFITPQCVRDIPKVLLVALIYPIVVLSGVFLLWLLRKKSAVCYWSDLTLQWPGNFCLSEVPGWWYGTLKIWNVKFPVNHSGPCTLRPPIQPEKYSLELKAVLKCRGMFIESIRRISLTVLKWREFLNKVV